MRRRSKAFVGGVAICVLLSASAGPAAAQQKTEQKAAPKAEQKAEPKSKKETLGKGEKAIAEDLAKQSGKSVDEILAMRKAGKGWGQIAQELGVKLGPAVRNGKGDQGKPAKEAKSAGKKEKPEKPAKKEK